MSRVQNTKGRLREICLLYPERFFDNTVFNEEKAKNIYLPDRTFKREKAYYAQIMKAIKVRKELLPLSVGLSNADIKICFDELLQANLIRCTNQTNNPTTLDFMLTLRGEEWGKMRNKVKWLIEQIAKLVPKISIA